MSFFNCFILNLLLKNHKLIIWIQFFPPDGVRRTTCLPFWRRSNRCWATPTRTPLPTRWRRNSSKKIGASTRNALRPASSKAGATIKHPKQLFGSSLWFITLTLKDFCLLRNQNQFEKMMIIILMRVVFLSKIKSWNASCFTRINWKI